MKNKPVLRQPIPGDIIKYRYKGKWDYSLLLKGNFHQPLTDSILEHKAGQPALEIVWKNDIPIARRWSKVPKQEKKEEPNRTPNDIKSAIRVLKECLTSPLNDV